MGDTISTDFKKHTKLVDLSEYYNNDGISYFNNMSDGRFNVWWNTFPAEELPESNSKFYVCNVPFIFPSKEDGLNNNIVCEGQFVKVPQGNYDWIYLLAAGERRTEDEVYLHFESADIDSEKIRISDFWPGDSMFGEPVGLKTKHMHYPNHIQRNHSPTIWLQRIPITRIIGNLKYIHLPENSALHIFCMTLIKSEL